MWESCSYPASAYSYTQLRRRYRRRLSHLLRKQILPWLNNTYSYGTEGTRLGTIAAPLTHRRHCHRRLIRLKLLHDLFFTCFGRKAYAAVAPIRVTFIEINQGHLVWHYNNPLKPYISEPLTRTALRYASQVHRNRCGLCRTVKQNRKPAACSMTRISGKYSGNRIPLFSSPARHWDRLPPLWPCGE